MSFFGSTADLIDAIGATIVLVLGVAVLLVKPHTPVSRTLGGFALSYGLWSLAYNLFSQDDPLEPAALRATLVFSVLTSLFVGRLAWLVPTPLRGRSRRLAVLAGLAAPLGVFTFGSLWHGITLVGLGDAAGSVGTIFALVLLALRYQGAPSIRASRQVAAVSIVLSLQPALGVGNALRLAGPVGASLSLAPLVLVAAGWLAHAHRGGETGRPARNVALSMLAVALLGSAATRLLGNVEGFFGVARVVMVALLAFAILRYQLINLEIRVKWTLRRGTLVTMFLAVFFAVSGLAEAFAQQYAGRASWMLGGVAAGLLLFALNPLQKLADRLANRAMPHVEDTREFRTVQTREVYRAALESALADHRISEKERDVLATLADQLGLSAGEARALEREVAAKSRQA